MTKEQIEMLMDLVKEKLHKMNDTLEDFKATDSELNEAFEAMGDVLDLIGAIQLGQLESSKMMENNNE